MTELTDAALIRHLTKKRRELIEQIKKVDAALKAYGVKVDDIRGPAVNPRKATLELKKQLVTFWENWDEPASAAEMAEGMGININGSLYNVIKLLEDESVIEPIERTRPVKWRRKAKET
jgi:hypothetical protein